MITLKKIDCPWSYTVKDDMPSIEGLNDLEHARFTYTARFQCSLEDLSDIIKHDFDIIEIDGHELHAKVISYDPGLMGEDGICVVTAYKYHEEIIDNVTKRESHQLQFNF